MTLLKIEDLVITVDSGANVVDGVSLSLDRGETFGLVGESGSGKTMTAMAVAGLLPAGARVTRGSITLGGVDLLALKGQSGRRDRSNRIAVVFQNPTTALNPRLSVGAQMREALRNFPRSERVGRSIDLLTQAGIPRAEYRLLDYPHELSGGLAQRVVIAMALARDAELLIADEPTTALDVTVQAEILDAIDGLRAERNLGVLLVSHDIAVIAERTQHVAVMRAGRIEEEAATSEVLENPRTEYTKLLIDAVPRLDSPAPVSTAETGAAPLLVVDDVRRDFVIKHGFAGIGRETRAALGGVSLSIASKEMVGIVGESGSGKSTLARTIVGLDRGYKGLIQFRGEDVKRGGNKRRERHRAIQFVFQDPFSALDPRLKVCDSISEPLRVQYGRKRSHEATVLSLMKEVGLPEHLSDRRPSALSGGQRQRVVIARALALDPVLLVADEAVSALDVSVQARILELLKELSRTRGLTLLFISHDLSVIRQLCDRTVVMRNGLIVEDRPTDEVFSDPRDDYTKKLIDAAPKFDRNTGSDLIESRFERRLIS
jgi:peptide/nickel transport system ATP-binding protein